MIQAFTLLLTLQLIGEVAARIFGLTLPGPVIGLVLLVVLCSIRPQITTFLRPTAEGLLRNLSLFFVPAGVGVVAHLHLLREHGTALALAIGGSTVLAIAAGAWAFVIVARIVGTDDDG